MLTRSTIKKQYNTYDSIVYNIQKVYPTMPTNQILEKLDTYNNITKSCLKSVMMKCDMGIVMIVPNSIILPNVNENCDECKSSLIQKLISRGASLVKIITLHYNVFDIVTSLLFFDKIKTKSILEITSFDWSNDDPSAYLRHLWRGDFYTHHYILLQAKIQKIDVHIKQNNNNIKQNNKLIILLLICLVMLICYFTLYFF